MQSPDDTSFAHLKVWEVVMLATALKDDVATTRYTRRLISMSCRDRTGTIQFLDNTLVHNIIDAGQLLEHVGERLRYLADEFEADPANMDWNFSPVSDMQRSSATSTVDGPHVSNQSPFGPHAVTMADVAPNRPQYGAQDFDMLKGSPTTSYRKHGPSQSPRSINSTQTAHQKRGRPQPYNRVNPARVAHRKRGGPRSYNGASPAQIANQQQRASQSSNPINFAPVVNVTDNQTNMLQAFSSVSGQLCDQKQGDLQSSSPDNAAPSADLTGYQAPDSSNKAKAALITSSQAPNSLQSSHTVSSSMEPHHTQTSVRALISNNITTSPQNLADDPHDTIPNTPISAEDIAGVGDPRRSGDTPSGGNTLTDDAGQGEDIPPGQSVMDDAAILLWMMQCSGESHTRTRRDE